MSRPPAVAGAFYPADARDLRTAVEALWPRPSPPRCRVLGALAPHAGYVYSGRVAAAVYARIQPAATYVLLGPNHTGQGAPVAVASARPWRTPLGSVRRDDALAEAFLRACPLAQEDDAAHGREHSLEVQLPFLQVQDEAFEILCVALGTWRPDAVGMVGEALAEVLGEEPGRAVLVASSDMNHFADLETTRRLDELALARAEALDPEGLLEVVARHGISMCGVGPAAAMLTAARRLGAKRVERVGYATSAEAAGDTRRVVGYAGLLVRS